ncbi:hypothetical protein M513_11276 [Trichuris suis]|uniref:Uncharacterized protein n=1 Tax=Trichuris suis TaxID=68888 RepID=A0A085LSB6_9BILA|nr:hypothetical protein M513_11276 [Trichuris suis]
MHGHLTCRYHALLLYSNIRILDKGVPCPTVIFEYSNFGQGAIRIMNRQLTCTCPCRHIRILEVPCPTVVFEYSNFGQGPCSNNAWRIDLQLPRPAVLFEYLNFGKEGYWNNAWLTDLQKPCPTVIFEFWTRDY